MYWAWFPWSVGFHLALVQILFVVFLSHNLAKQSNQFSEAFGFNIELFPVLKVPIGKLVSTFLSQPVSNFHFGSLNFPCVKISSIKFFSLFLKILNISHHYFDKWQHNVDLNFLFFYFLLMVVKQVIAICLWEEGSRSRVQPGRAPNSNSEREIIDMSLGSPKSRYLL